MTSDTKTDIAVSAALVTSCLIAFSPVLTADFINFDDSKYVTMNPFVQGGLECVYMTWTTFAESNWHPLTWMSLQLDFGLFGLNPTAFHAMNLAYHALATVLLYVALRRMRGPVGRSSMVTALFALHPLHVESVAWVADRTDVLCGVFWMLTLGAYADYALRPSLRRYAAVVIPFALGITAKPMIVTLPCVLCLLDYWPLGRLRFGQALPAEAGAPALTLRLWFLEKMPLFLLSAASCWITTMARQTVIATWSRYPLWVRILNAASAYVGYLRHMFWPINLAAFYPHPKTSIAVAPAVAALALLVLVTLICLRYRRAAPYLLVGWLWYLGTLVPMIGFVQVGSQASADRYTYIPLVGIFLAMTWGAADLAVRLHKQRLAAVSAVAILIACIVLTFRQACFWHDSLTLWRHTIAVERKNPRALLLLGDALLTAGELPEAANCFRASLDLAPDVAQTHFKLAAALIALGRKQEAADEARIGKALSHPSR